MRKWTTVLAVVMLAVVAPPESQAQFVQTDNVAFEALNQNMWGGGTATSLSWNSGDLLTTSWNVSGSVGGIIGQQNEQLTPYFAPVFSPEFLPTLITPYIPPFQITPFIPAVYSPYIPPVQITPAVPRICLGFLGCTPAVPAVYTPAVPSFLITPAIPALYSPAIPAVYSPFIPSVQLTPAIPATFVDSRTGAAFTGSTSGEIGLEVGAYITSGRVDVMMPGVATLTTDGLFGERGEVYTIGTGFVVDPNATLETQFPTLELYADFIFDVQAEGTLTGCLFALGCASDTGVFLDVDERLELLAINRDGSGTVNILGLDTGLLPLGTSVGPVNIDVFLPNLETDASAASTSLTSSGDVDVLRAGVDVPALIADFILPGSSCLLSCDFLGVGYTVLGSSLGPDFGIGQEFTFTSTPMTTLAFNIPVSRIVGGVTLAPTLSFDVEMGTNLDILFPEAVSLDITPTYWLANSLNVDTDFLTRGTFSVDILSFDTPFGSLGPLYSYTTSTADLAIGIRDETFALAFNSHVGSTFTVRDVSVPEPPVYLLLITGLLAMCVGARRRTALECDVAA